MSVEIEIRNTDFEKLKSMNSKKLDIMVYLFCNLSVSGSGCINFWV